MNIVFINLNKKIILIIMIKVELFYLKKMIIGGYL